MMVVINGSLLQRHIVGGRQKMNAQRIAQAIAGQRGGVSQIAATSAPQNKNIPRTERMY